MAVMLLVCAELGVLDHLQNQGHKYSGEVQANLLMMVKQCRTTVEVIDLLFRSVGRTEKKLLYFAPGKVSDCLT